MREGVGRLNWRMRAERIRPQSLTRILASLTDRGLVTRNPGPRRQAAILDRHHPAGRAVMREYTGSRERWLSGALERALSPTERQLLEMAAELLIRAAER